MIFVYDHQLPVTFATMCKVRVVVDLQSTILFARVTYCSQAHSKNINTEMIEAVYSTTSIHDSIPFGEAFSGVGIYNLSILGGVPVARGIGPSIIILGPVAHHSFLSSGVQYSVSWVRSFFRMGEEGGKWSI